MAWDRVADSSSGAMAGRVCVVTGANSGIGKEVVRGLARQDATVVLACRSPERGEAARQEIEADSGNRKLAVMELDLARQPSVRAFVAAFTARYPRLHVLVNNAGVFAAKRVLTVEGLESTFAVNHVSHFLLTNLLLPTLRASAPSRIVNVSSEANQAGTIDFADLTLARWSGFRAYTQSKLANVLFTVELARRLRGTGVTANAVHPGGVRTNWSKGSGAMRFGMLLAWPFLIPPEKGADTVVYLASSREVEGISGKYFIRRKTAEPNPVANDAALAQRLWEVSESLAGLRTDAGAGAPT